MDGDKLYSILIVDDEVLNRMFLQAILSKDYHVITAQTGQEALSHAVSSHPDLILLDIIMPDISGFDVLKQLKSSSLTADISVIVITGLTRADDEEKGFLLGAVDYITKPFKDTIVRARVRTHVQILRQIRTIEQLGLLDPVTEIPNRRCFDNRIDMEWKRAIRNQNPISFLMIDIDHFKAYNDQYGHPQGDMLLKAVAQTLAASAQRPADLAVRMGGEEFAVLLPDTAWEAGLFIGEKIRRDVQETQVPAEDGAVTSVTVSIGLTSCVPKRGQPVKDFIAQADAYLYAAKTSGRNQIRSE
ncbi:MAG: diguanylate cyclase [Clostridiales bacterium]|jgi:diguanylate cyclase (GGDEF)-like protein|nr:diguanylate cyclase [Clostridiales bacterium]